MLSKLSLFYLIAALPILCVYLKEPTLRFLKQMEGNVFSFKERKEQLILGKLKFSFYLFFYLNHNVKILECICTIAHNNIKYVLVN